MPRIDRADRAPRRHHKTLDVSVAVAPAEQRSLFANLLQLYLYDFSEFAAIGTEHGEPGSDGLFSYRWLDLYWQEPGRVPISLRADGHIAGFALLNQCSPLGLDVDQVMAEFFVLRKYRRHGVGREAVRQILAQWPGRWEIPIALYNTPALAFWPAAIRDAIGWTAEAIDGDGERWSGPVLCFDNRSTEIGPVMPDRLGRAAP